MVDTISANLFTRSKTQKKRIVSNLSQKKGAGRKRVSDKR